MNAPLIILHEEALRISHPVFNSAPQNTNAIFIWDDEYLQRANYSLKRLIFIYETLCELPVQIIHGRCMDVVNEIALAKLLIPATNNPLIIANFEPLNAKFVIEIIEDEVFAQVNQEMNYRRFFQYWKYAEKTAFLIDGGVDAKRR